MARLTPAQIKAALSRPLPGLAAQAKMASLTRPLRPPAAQHRPRQGGVLLLLYPKGGDGELHLVLTRRSDSVANHKGQISLPGGGMDPEDLSTIHTALRETCEELAVCSGDLQLLGDLTPLYIPPSDYYIHPHVAYLPWRPAFQPRPEEVAELLEAPISHFMDADNIRAEDWEVRGEVVRVPFFDLYGHKVWGATAMVLAEFVAAIQSDL